MHKGKPAANSPQKRREMQIRRSLRMELSDATGGGWRRGCRAGGMVTYRTSVRRAQPTTSAEQHPPWASDFASGRRRRDRVDARGMIDRYRDAASRPDGHGARSWRPLGVAVRRGGKWPNSNAGRRSPGCFTTAFAARWAGMYRIAGKRCVGFALCGCSCGAGPVVAGAHDTGDGRGHELVRGFSRRDRRPSADLPTRGTRSCATGQRLCRWCCAAKPRMAPVAGAQWNEEERVLSVVRRVSCRTASCPRGQSRVR